MRSATYRLTEPSTPRLFDVICAGEALWNLTALRGAFSMRSSALRLRPGGGAANAALALAQQGFRVGLATTLTDDSFGRTVRDRLAAAGVDTGGVSLVPQRLGLVLVTGEPSASKGVPTREEDHAFAVPAGWSSRILLLSGLSPGIAQGASLCKAARAARRRGTPVLVDLNARYHLWTGRDPRAIRSLLAEADVVRCSAEDLAVLRLDEATVRSAMRARAVLVMSRRSGEAWAKGPFGEVRHAPRDVSPLRPPGAGDVFTAAICAELTRRGDLAEGREDRWAQTLQRGQAAVLALGSAR
ncbi:PfkB family carbohydrate kinase [Chondromyces crocatus]|uniref:Carbohydrate kinase PfkB domain-containing protein n=1 Tax=Chondromyces crocatus TaxID=52 RepID=A0A0K1ENX0_CHOCO|nr:PfkB family carbohydrate kinase [Chondromyces crocatus]AKT42595.1 uncharacterized protein CMC5_068220 [Chondromyces crocatus]